MKLSIVIVNYNVEHFLEQCLHSVRKSINGIEAEVFVVDNNSVDGSVAMVKDKFPEVHLVENKKNTGFSFANNQAIKVSRGEYVLLLNPDTVVEEDTFEKILVFMDAHGDAGGLGVKMLDGKGNFLPESKRGLPTPAVAFYKISGLSKLFPKSKTFGRYHLGFLHRDEVSSVDVLAGAFMLLRRSVLDKIGLLDEDFFMYGEDIDLSYRITKAGYKNYYFPGTRIIHYKGESTKKSSVNYVFVFYNAMVIFARKHFSNSNAKTFSFLINMAIYLRAGMSISARVVRKMFLPFCDAALLLGGLLFIKDYYEHNIKFIEGGSYSLLLVWTAFPGYILVWLFSVYLSGGYDKPVKLVKIVRGIFVGTAVILIIYSLLPETYRFSRALILFGAGWAMLAMLASRMLLHFMRIKKFALDGNENKRIIIVGKEQECSRVNSLLRQTSLKTAFVGYVNCDDLPTTKKELYLGSLSQLDEVIQVYKIDEVIFCASDLSAQVIIGHMSERSGTVDYKIAPPESLSIIGSNSIDTSGDLYVIDINSISKVSNRRNKRVLDIVIAMVLLLILPITLLLVKSFFGVLANIFSVLAGSRSWVGASGLQQPKSLKKGVLEPSDVYVGKELNAETKERLHLLYARDYRAWNDINIVLKGFRQLGRR